MNVIILGLYNKFDKNILDEQLLISNDVEIVGIIINII
jgi:hypothetical protein